MNETGWTCDQCGEFNTHTAVCTSCGAVLEGAKTRQGLKQVGVGCNLNREEPRSLIVNALRSSSHFLL